MGKWLIGFRIPGPNQQFGTTGELGKLFTGEHDDLQFQAMASAGDLAIQNASPVMETLPQFGKIRMNAVAGGQFHQSGRRTSTGTG